MLITTTNNIENGKITKYLDVVSSTVVIGVNILSEFIASFTDFFGGKSGTYETKLNAIFSESLNNLSKKAKKLGADAIVGLKMDYEEISGKDKSMIMVYAMGTAVRISFDSNQPNKKNDSPNSDILVTGDELYKYIITKKYKEKLSTHYPTHEDYEDIIHNMIYGLEQEVYNLYTETDSRRVDEQTKTICHNLLDYQLENVSIDDACDLVYSKATEVTCRFLVCRYIIERRLFNPRKILEFLEEGENKVATILLEADKDFYTKEDYLMMQKIVEKLDILSNSNYSLDNEQKAVIKQFKEKVNFLDSYIQINTL